VHGIGIMAQAGAGEQSRLGLIVVDFRAPYWF
jgi:hypothetical protein